MKEALKLARDWIADRPADRPVSAGKMISIIDRALAQPPLPVQRVPPPLWETMLIIGLAPVNVNNSKTLLHVVSIVSHHLERIYVSNFWNHTLNCAVNGMVVIMNTCTGNCDQGRRCTCGLKQRSLFWDVMEGAVTLSVVIGVFTSLCFAFGYLWYWMAP